jgi:SAM-dependent methyltransferase
MARRASSAVRALDQRFYPSFQDNWDDVLLRERILRQLVPGMRVLDLGAGAGIVKQMDLRGTGVRVHGVDLDPRVVDNPFLDEAKVGSAEQIPYPEGAFDLVFCDNVLEHLPDPDAAFAEVARVLRPGGAFLFKTPNSMHYMPLVARLTPHRFHRFYNRLRGRASGDTFPTRYRANSRGALRALARRARLEVDSIELIEGRPEYLRISAPTYIAGIAYERLVNRWQFLEPFRVILVGCVRKPRAVATAPD